MHVFTSQIPLLFGIRTPRGIGKILKLPRFYVKIFRLLYHEINWMSTAIGLVSIVVLYVAKSLNDRYKSTIRIVLPTELILVCLFSIKSKENSLFFQDDYVDNRIIFH